jgi:hypothetical protein
VHLYQQKLDALQPTVSSTTDSSTSADDSTAAAATGDAAAEAPVDIKAAAGAPATAPDGAAVSGKESSAAVLSELQRLEQQLSVEDILLCRSLAELALERQNSSRTGECLTGFGVAWHRHCTCQRARVAGLLPH